MLSIAVSRCSLLLKRSAVEESPVDVGDTYRDAISILLADALSLSLALLERVLVLELGSHG